MNLILLYKEDFVDDQHVVLHGRRHQHIKAVLGATPGKCLLVGQLNGKTGVGIVDEIASDQVRMQVHLDQEPPPASPVTLILALPRPKVLKRIIQSITAMGVKRLIVLNSWRVDKSYWQSPLLNQDTLNEQCILGLEQARDTVLPTIEIAKRFKPFVEDNLPGLVNNTYALLAHPEAKQPCPANIMQATTLAIGPEGGFTDYEVTKLEEAGMTGVRLGTRPMRVETAVSAFLGRLI